MEGGIYDRCIDNKSFAEKHRISAVKGQIHQVSREIAMWMFENKPEEANISQEEYQKISNKVMHNEQKNKETGQDFLIGNFFKLVKHCEGIETEELYFVHRTIYEYFVAETIYSSIKSSIMKLSEESQEELAGNIAFYLKKGKISLTIGKYLQHKIIELYNKLDIEKKKNFYQWWESTANKMMESGMFYYTKRSIQDYEDIIEKETRCFLNLLEILRLLLPTTNRKYIMERCDVYKIRKYIGLGQWGNYSGLFLKEADLKGMNLHKLNLEEVCLRGANISRTDLIEANLYKADLVGANISRAYLKGAELGETKLIEANLFGADLSGTVLNRAKLNGADLSGVKLIETKLIEANLSEATLIDADLSRADLSRADLRGTDLSRAKLCKTNLVGAKLNGASLVGANLFEINLIGADLGGVIFDEKQIEYLKQDYNLEDTSVFIRSSLDIISFKEYCKRKQ
jgi:Uncharacterized low-complexity proteins